MTPELRAELDRIEDFLMGPQGNQLANVLSALRGPDEPERAQQKQETTVFIRAAAFPRLERALNRYYGVMDGPNSEFHGTKMWAFPTSRDRYVPTDPIGSHFEQHISSAAHALGLETKPLMLPSAYHTPYPYPYFTQRIWADVLKDLDQPKDPQPQKDPK